MNRWIIDWYFVALVVSFVVAGSVSPILIELLVLNGAAEPSTMLVLLPSFIGMGLSIFTNKDSMYIGQISVWMIVLLTLLDLASHRITNQGMVDAGSTIYTVVHCSGTIFTACFAVMVLHRNLYFNHWAGIVIISIGLAVIVAGVQAEGRAVFDGIIFILCGTLIHSFSYIVIEYSLVHAENPVAPEFLCAMLGLTGGMVNVAWQCLYTLPRFQHLVVDNIAAHRGSLSTIVLAYAALTIAGCVSATCLYRLLHSAGSATTGVIKGLQAVLTFVSSHFAFCGIQPSQCFTATKGVSLAIVLTGVLIYSATVVPPPSPESADQQEPYDLSEGERWHCLPTATAVRTFSTASIPPSPRYAYTSVDVELVPILERELVLTPKTRAPSRLLPIIGDGHAASRGSYGAVPRTNLEAAHGAAVSESELALGEMLL